MIGTVAVETLAGIGGAGISLGWTTAGWASSSEIGIFSLLWTGKFDVVVVVACSPGLVVSTGEVGCETFADAGKGFLTILRSVLVDSMLPLPVASCLCAFAEAAMASSDGVSKWM